MLFGPWSVCLVVRCFNINTLFLGNYYKRIREPGIALNTSSAGGKR